MFGIAPSATREGTKGPKNGPKGLQALLRSSKKGAECPKFLVIYKCTSSLWMMLFLYGVEWSSLRRVLSIYSIVVGY